MSPHLRRLPFADMQIGAALLHDDGEELVDVRHFLTADYADDTDGELGSKVRHIAGTLLPDDALPVQSRVLEVQEQGELEPGDVQIANHLSNVCFVESANHFGVDDHSIIDNQIGNEVAD